MSKNFLDPRTVIQASKNNKPKNNISIVVDDLQTLQNLGLIVRTAHCFGATKMFLGPRLLGEAKERSAKLKGFSAGTLQYLELKPIQDIEFENYLVIGLDFTETSRPITEFNATERDILLIIGHENNGIPNYLYNKCNNFYHINMYGTISSFNVAVATSIAMDRMIN